MKYLGWSCLPLVLLWSALHAQQPASKLSESEKLGERLYLQRCALCHSGTAPAYATYGPPLDSQLVTRRGDESVRKLIMEGSARMPGFRYSLEPAQVDRIIAFLKTLKDSSYTAEVEPAGAPLAARLAAAAAR